MHARIISERDFQTIHLKIITHKKALFMSNDLNDLLMSFFLVIWARPVSR